MGKLEEKGIAYTENNTVDEMLLHLLWCSNSRGQDGLSELW